MDRIGFFVYPADPVWLAKIELISAKSRSEGNLAVVGHEADGLNALQLIHSPHQLRALGRAQLQHQIQRLRRHVPGLDAVMFGVFRHRLTHRVLRLQSLRVHHQNHGRFGNRQLVQKQKAHRQAHGQNYRNLGHSRAADNADADGPEQKGDVARLLDGGAEANDGKRAHHAQRKRQIAADGQHGQRGDHGNEHQRAVEIFAVHNAGKGFSVYKIHQQCQQHGRCERQ